MMMSLQNLQIFLKILKLKIIKRTWDDVKYDKDYMKIRFQSNNILPTDKDVSIHLATIII